MSRFSDLRSGSAVRRTRLTTCGSERIRNPTRDQVAGFRAAAYRDQTVAIGVVRGHRPWPATRLGLEFSNRAKGRPRSTAALRVRTPFGAMRMNSHSGRAFISFFKEGS